MSDSQFPQRGETERATALQYNETWSASESTERFSFGLVTPDDPSARDMNRPIVQEVSRLGRQIGRVVRDQNDDWWSAFTLVGKYVGQYESKREAIEVLADWS